MFERQYSTREVAETLDLNIQTILWELIIKWKSEGVELDYLQVYDLSMEFLGGEVYQKIIHSQEIPKRTETFYYRNISNPINAKIFVIDEDGNGVMMFSAEY